MAIEVHPRVMERHPELTREQRPELAPELTREDVLSAWENAYWYKVRLTPEKAYHVAIGADSKSRFVEMVASEEDDGTMLVFHAMTPPSAKTLEELGIRGR